MDYGNSFWIEMERLALTSPIIIDRPKGSSHPRYPEAIYPLDYGYLQDTTANDGDGIDVWIGPSARKILTGILCTFDTIQRDAEIKRLIGCTKDDIDVIRAFHSPTHTLYMPNPGNVR